MRHKRKRGAVEGALAVVVNDLRPFGAQRVAVATAMALADLGVAITVITLEPRSVDELALPSSINRLELSRPPGKVLGLCILIWRMRRALLSVEPAAVISHMVFSNWLTIAGARSTRLGRRIPVVITEHSLTRNVLLEPSGRIVSLLARLTYRYADALVGVSEAVRLDACRRYKFPTSRSETIYNPVDVVALRQAAESPPPHPWLETRGPLHPTYVAVGRLVPVKDFGTLLRAVAIAPEARLLIIGEGPERVKLERECAELGICDRVRLLGHRHDVAPFIKYADALVSTSRWEGFGLTIVEAAALGTFVVAADVPALNELIPKYVPGILVPGGDPVALQEALRQALVAFESPAHLSAFDPVRVGERYLAATRGQAS